jgi:Uma2 family endonuclease
MEAKKPKTYKTPASEPAVVEEPFAIYGYKTLDLDESKRYSYADYLTWMDDERRELINGFIHLMSAPLRVHAHIVTELGNLFYSVAGKKKKKRYYIYYAPFDVRLPLNNETADDQIYNVVQPDICIISDPSKLDDKGCIGAPDLIVEILSPSTLKKDWNDKFNLYEAAGVMEYWIVDPNTKTVNVFLLQTDGRYDMGATYNFSQKTPVYIIEGLEIDLSELFENE